jgi:hypothetical protein
MVRGKLVRMGYPIPNVRVNVYSTTLGFSGSTFSGLDGIYYLNGVPYGNYFLQVWANQVNPAVPFSYPIQVFWPMTDIAVLSVP